MILKTTYTKETEIDIALPFFRKSISSSNVKRYGAVLDEKTFIKWLEITDNYLNYNTSIPSESQRDVIEVFSEWEVIDEIEFMEAHENVIAGLSLSPKLVRTTENDIPDQLFNNS